MFTLLTHCIVFSFISSVQKSMRFGTRLLLNYLKCNKSNRTKILSACECILANLSYLIPEIGITIKFSLKRHCLIETKATILKTFAIILTAMRVAVLNAFKNLTFNKHLTIDCSEKQTTI